MTKLLDVVQPIALLSGSHADTAQTGQGCFMNVIAYLNGEPQITDESPCVCVSVRPIAIWINDYMSADERLQLLPYIERALGSATSDQAELSRRAWRAVKMAEEMRDFAAASVASAVSNAMAASNASNARDARAVWVASAESAESAASAARAAMAAKAANAASAASAARVARAAVTESAESAARAARAAKAANAESAASRQQIIDSVLRYLDDVLPRHQAPAGAVERAVELVLMAAQ